MWVLSSCGPDDVIPINTDTIRNADEADNYMERLYSGMYNRSIFLNAYLFLPLLYSDNCYYAGEGSTAWQNASDFDVQADNALNLTLFSDFYNLNGDLKELFAQMDTTEHETLTEEVKDGFRAEARAIRAVIYFYLNAYWGNVPILLEDTETVDSLVPGATDQELFELVEGDLLFAAAHIAGNTYATSRHRLGTAAVNAWLARFYLQNQRYDEALVYAEAVLQDGGAELEENVGDAYAAASNENIWVLEEDIQGTSIALYFLQPFANGLHAVRPRAEIAFEEGDARRAVALSQPGNTVLKYTDIATNNDPVYLFRLPEAYLIAAEAAIRASNDFETASGYLNVLRRRAGLDDVELNAGNFEEVLLHERNAELCYEGFHRLMDLRRFGVAEEVLGPYGYEERDARWPMPQAFLDVFSSVEQNPGY